MKTKLSILLSMLIISFCSYGQLIINNANEFYTVDFDNTIQGVNNGSFAGTGFSTTPSDGQLNANAWAVIGTSEGDKDFEENADDGVFAKGIPDPTMDEPGIYAVELDVDNMGIGIMASDDDFTPGYIALKIQNNTGVNALGITMSYDIYYVNDGDRSTKITGWFSPNNSIWIPFSGLDFITPAAADANPELNHQHVTITGEAPINDGNYFYFRIQLQDEAGSGDRDQIAFDNISFMLHDNQPCIPLNISDNILFPTNIFTETFEESSEYLHCWTQEFEAGTNEWTYQTGSNMGAINQAYEGTVNARFTSTPGGPHITKLISPQFNLTNVSDPVVRFWYGQEQISANQNELKVYYRTAPGEPWNEIAHYTDNINVWTLVPYLELPNPSANYQIAFEGIDNNGAANVVDYVSVLSQDNLPIITDTDVNNNVQNVTVCIGTEDVNVPLNMLVTHMTIRDSYNLEYVVELDWSIPDYNGNIVGNYEAIGTFELPVEVEPNPLIDLQVTTDVIVADLPDVTCPDNITLETEQIYNLTGASPAGGTYFFDGNPISSFNTATVDNGHYTIEYIYTDPVSQCVNSCEFIITVQLPSEIQEIDYHDDVEDIYVCIGTSQSQAITQLAQVITILDSNGGEHSVTVNWSIEGYNGNVQGVHNAVGTFQMPEGVLQTDPITPLVVYATVTVAANPTVTCPQSFSVLITDEAFNLEGASPEGGEYTINGNPYFLFNPQFQGLGEHTVIYTYTDPITGCSGTCSFVITVQLETGINEAKLSDYSIYPNPNTGSFNIILNNKLSNVTYKIYDTKGSIIDSGIIYDNNTEINLTNDIKSGVYYIKLITENNTLIEKLIIK